MNTQQILSCPAWKKNVPLTSSLAVLLAFAAMTASAQIDMFIQFATPASGAPTIAGDSQDLGFPGSSGWSKIQSTTSGAQNPVSISGGVITSGRTTFTDFVLTKPVNVATPGLFQALASGGHYGLVTVVLRAAGAPSTQSFLKYEYKNVYFTQQDTGGSSGDSTAQETVRMIYGSFRITYTPRNTDGTYGTPVVGAWNQTCNCSTF